VWSRSLAAMMERWMLHGNPGGTCGEPTDRH